jgi:hypothetical protein
MFVANLNFDIKNAPVTNKNKQILAKKYPYNNAERSASGLQIWAPRSALRAPRSALRRETFS